MINQEFKLDKKDIEIIMTAYCNYYLNDSFTDEDQYILQDLSIGDFTTLRRIRTCKDIIIKPRNTEL